MTMSDRGIHPDLIDDEQSAGAAAETPSPPRRGRAARAAPASSGPPQEPAQDTSAAQDSEPASVEAPGSAEAQAAAEPPEWWLQVKDAPDPKVALALLAKNMPWQEMEQDPTLQGRIGDAARRRMDAMRIQDEQNERARQKREALANADFYGLGQLTAPEIQQQIEQNTSAAQGAPFMEGVAAFQRTLPDEVQSQVGGKNYAPGRSYSEGVAEYLQAVTEAAISHRLNEAVEQELKRREPALRKAGLSELNGNQPVPELDGGRASVVREITDEQVGRMTMAEYDTYFDERGQPRPGTRVRLTRAVNLREQMR